MVRRSDAPLPLSGSASPPRADATSRRLRLSWPATCRPSYRARSVSLISIKLTVATAWVELRWMLSTCIGLTSWFRAGRLGQVVEANVRQVGSFVNELTGRLVL